MKWREIEPNCECCIKRWRAESEGRSVAAIGLQTSPIDGLYYEASLWITHLLCYATLSRYTRLDSAKRGVERAMKRGKK